MPKSIGDGETMRPIYSLNSHSNAICNKCNPVIELYPLLFINLSLFLQLFLSGRNLTSCLLSLTYVKSSIDEWYSKFKCLIFLMFLLSRVIKEIFQIEFIFIKVKS